MSVSTGLISGIDYSTMITQLMQVEANPQTLLKTQLSATQADAAAYRAVNTRFDALRTAAAALTDATAWNATKTTSTSTNVTATAGTTAVSGTAVTFAVTQLSGTHSLVSGTQWSSKTAPVRDQDPVWPITIKNTATGATTSIDVGATATLTDAAAAINAANAGVQASVIQLGKDQFRLQLTSTTSGAAGAFEVISSPRPDGTTPAEFLTTDQGQDALLTLGGGLTATSSTNTFTDLVPGVTITATKADASTSITVGVSADPSAVASKVQSLVDAANALQSAISSYTDAESTSAVLKGDTTLRGLSNQIMSVVSTAVGGVSASTVGIQLNRDGTFAFDKTVFTTALTADPAKVQKVFAEKKIESAGTDGISGNADDVTSPIGLAAQLEVLAKGASDTTTGSLVQLATSQDALAKDLQARIDAWDIRLELRKTTLTRQFTAMETALSTMQNQASWLSSQIAGLPSWSSSNK
ncbi:flagellar filament capping protein FliD [Modestobacter italicus]|uniref:flagellar filament capping protein FliD n=1 Tax=Modestobacter italicus (strain DSM 44449 / CECT 9708 / BC 501) TaxID=2732864 RepID=UPI001C941200|nr:flagellar filament capping protein FliD [Modestobacter italicus]